MTGSYFRSDLTYLNLIFCGPEQTEENWQSQGRCGYIHPPLSVQSLQINMDQHPRFIVVHGSVRLLNRFCKDIMQSSQWLLDVLGNHGWNVVAIKGQLDQMSSIMHVLKAFGLVDFLGCGKGAHWR